MLNFGFNARLYMHQALPPIDSVSWITEFNIKKPNVSHVHTLHEVINSHSILARLNKYKFKKNKNKNKNNKYEKHARNALNLVV